MYITFSGYVSIWKFVSHVPATVICFAYANFTIPVNQYLLGCVKEEENVYFTIISIAISTISELSVLSSPDFSAEEPIGWRLLGELGTFVYGELVLMDISVSFSLYNMEHQIKIKPPKLSIIILGIIMSAFFFQVYFDLFTD